MADALWLIMLKGLLGALLHQCSCNDVHYMSHALQAKYTSVASLCEILLL